MTTVPGMRSNDPVSMDIDQLRGWASFMDGAVIVSLIATILAVAALGTTTFLSFRYGSAVRAHEQAALDHYKSVESQAAQHEREAAAARERAASLEREIATARGRTAMLEQEVSSAHQRAAALVQEAAMARERAAALEQAARDAGERAAQAAQERAAAAEKAATPAFDAAAIRQRLADIGKLVRDATTRSPAPESVPAPAPAPLAEKAVEPSPPPSPPPSPFVASLKKFAGTKAALFLLGQVSDAPAIGATISADLGAAGWAPETWTWGGVAGIFGVVVLVRDGSDAATNEAPLLSWKPYGWPASTRPRETGRPTGGRFRGTLNGPQVPAPTDAAIRIVVGSKARGA